MGHYEEDEFNKRYDNYEMSPNDVYTDGAVVGLIGNNTMMMKSEKLFADAYFHLILYYRLEEVKAGVIYLQNVKEFQDLTHYGRQRHTFTDEGEDLTNVSDAERLQKKGLWQLNVYANEGEFFAVDTVAVADGQADAEGDVYGPNATFTTRTPGMPKNS